MRELDTADTRCAAGLAWWEKWKMVMIIMRPGRSSPSRGGGLVFFVSVISVSVLTFHISICERSKYKVLEKFVFSARHQRRFVFWEFLGQNWKHCVRTL
jgi:hypothetical protein